MADKKETSKVSDLDYTPQESGPVVRMATEPLNRDIWHRVKDDKGQLHDVRAGLAHSHVDIEELRWLESLEEQFPALNRYHHELARLAGRY